MTSLILLLTSAPGWILLHNLEMDSRKKAAETWDNPSLFGLSVINPREWKRPFLLAGWSHHLDIRKKYHKVRRKNFGDNQSNFPREVFELLHNLVWAPFPIKAWTRWSFEVSSKLGCSVILWSTCWWLDVTVILFLLNESVLFAHHSSVIWSQYLTLQF